MQFINMITVDQILNEEDNYSQLSVDASFTLQDILQQPPDEQIAIFNNLQEIDNIDAMFEDDMFQNDQQQNNQHTNKSKDKQIEFNAKIIQSNQNQIKIIAKNDQPKAKEIRRHARLTDFPLPSVEKIKNMVFTALKNVTQLFDIANSESRGVGVPTCISTSGNKFLALGTSIGNVVVFQIGVKGYKILSTPDQNKYGQTTSVSVSRDNRYLVAGYQTGLIVLWDLYTFKNVKTLLLQKNRILKILFCSDNYENFVSTDSDGFIYMYTIENYLWTGIKSQLLIDKSQNIYYDIKYCKIKSGRTILALSNYNSVLVLSLKPTISIIGSIQRPEGFSANKLPNCEVGEGQQRKVLKSQNNQENNGLESTQHIQYIKQKDNYICVSWGKFIYVYTLSSSNSQTQSIKSDFIIQQGSGIHNMEFITNGVLLTLDNRQVFRLINIKQQKLRLKQGEKKIMSSPINQTQLEAETIYQRCLKDKQGKYIKNYSNTIVSCSHNPKYKEIFLISKNAVYRGRLEKWTDYIHHLLVDEHNWQLALKLCLELYKGNYNIFAQQFTSNNTTISLLCDIGKIFLKQRIKEIQTKRTQLNSIREVQEETKQLFQIIIQYFSTIDCQTFMFSNVYKDIKQKYFYQYEQLFIESLQPFIQNCLINEIPTKQIFVRILQFYTKKPQLINKLIVSLRQGFLYFEQTVEICTREKLFESLCYICSANGDFISPANKIIDFLKEHPQHKQQLENLSNYLTNLIQLKFQNGKPFEKYRENALKDLSVWMVCDQTLQFLVQNFEKNYFLMLKNLSNKLVSNQQLIVQVPILAEQVMSKIGIIRKFKQLPKLIQFLMGLGLSPKIHYSQELCRQILNTYLQIYETKYNYQFQKQFKYKCLLKFLEKYLLDKSDNSKILKKQFQQKLFPKINIWVRLVYKMLAFQSQEQLNKQSPQLLRNQDEGRDMAVGYLFQNYYKYSEVIKKYQDLLIQWCPQQSLLYIIQTKAGNGIRQINKSVLKIQDQKLRYAVVRKILRLLRIKSRQIISQSDNQIGKILKASIEQLHNPTLQQLASHLVQTTISDQILIFYISSICKYKKQKRVFYELTQNQQQYKPLATKLVPVIKQYGYKSCLGFLYDQQLRLEDAFNQYNKVYIQYFQQNFRKLISHQYCHGRFMTKIFYFMLDLCNRINKENQWKILVTAILKPLKEQDPFAPNNKIRVIDTIQNIYSKKSSKQHPFMLHLIQVIQLALTSMSREVPINSMAQYLTEFIDLLSKQFIVNCLIATLKGCSKRVQTFQISQRLMISQFVNEFQQFFEQNKLQGSCTNIVCNQCQQVATSRNYNSNIQQIKFEVLKCRHAYHKDCFMKNYYQCKICTRKQYGDEIATKSQNQKIKEVKIQNLAETKVKIKQIEMEMEGSSHVYRYLAIQDFLKRQQQDFQQFRNQYEDYITSYKNN